MNGPAFRRYFPLGIVLIALASSGVWYFLKAQSIARQTLEARNLVERSNTTLEELMSLYKERLQRIQSLLVQIHATPLNSEWTRIETWKSETDEDLARFDQNQNSISNYVSEAMSQATQAKPKKSSKGTANSIELFKDFERFEQKIVMKRKQYFDLYQQLLGFSRRLSVDPPIVVPPMFPVEKQLAEKQLAEK